MGHRAVITIAGVMSGVGLHCGSFDAADPTSSPSPNDSGIGARDAGGESASLSTASRFVFVTAGQREGDMGQLGGLNAADGFCNEEARKGVPELQGHRFAALLGSLLGPAIGRVSRGGGSYVLPDRTVVAPSFEALLGGELAHAIDKDQTGESITGRAWTGMTAQGTASTDTCLGWTQTSATSQGATGSITETRFANWMAGASSPCTTDHHLYCVETD